MDGERKRGMGTVDLWIGAWLGGAVIGVANGAARELAYGRALPEPAANGVSAATASAAFLGYFALLQRRRPLRSRRQALLVGGVWTALTVCFEFGLGRVQGKAWSDMSAEYDVRHGRLWPFVLLVVALGPEATRRRAG
ncbi:MAG TPA: hypothetical protein VHE08_08145 [Solirubrobacterales bacterium]|nr:hypothetical protein [Solirubrobacterales bacterium]